MDTLRRIVLIDDDRAWLEALSEYLRSQGFDVLATVSPLEGLQLAHAQQAALVVCDYNMPQIDGLQLVHLLRERAYRAAVLMVSNASERSLARRALAAGAQAFLEKSTAPGQLLRKVRQLLESAPREDQPDVLKLWQRLLPGPKSGAVKRAKDKSAGRASRDGGSRTNKQPC
jgi:DNA-binding response OmpR family regulator